MTDRKPGCITKVIAAGCVVVSVIGMMLAIASMIMGLILF